ncbi:MAG: site-2 protease family protein [Candidatus Liptonbacteria bacterium]|nr:site-2 protease family protein [Candidatus Liptonbacteria bacterium]
MNDAVFLVFQLAVLLFSVMIHEISHGYVAEKLGDPTARLMGRLTLNPMKHLDPVGSILVPIFLYLSTQGTFVFAWAKPVPYNPSRLKDPRSAAGKIAFAGPLANLFLAVVFGVFLRIGDVFGFASAPLLPLFFGTIVYLNILLAVFNLVPIPPLDGSKVLFAALPPTESNFKLMNFLERYGFFLVLFFIFFAFDLIIPIIRALFILIAGKPFF